MMTSKLNRRWVLTMIAGAIVLAAGFFGLTEDRSPVYAQGSDFSIYGYAWSDTVGWISFNDSGYGLSIAQDGTFSGYAWSDTVGWISANSSDLAGCPSAPCTARIDTDGEIHGWFRAIAGGTAQSGGWDGFISLSGSDYGARRQSGGDLTGYGWGSTVVGWVDFSYASTNYVPEPTADIQVRKVGDSEWQDSLTIEMLEEIEIGWNQDHTTNTTSCVAVPPANGFQTGNAISGVDSDVTEPIGNTSLTYRVLCYGEEDIQKDNAVTVTTIGGEGAQLNFCDPELASGFVRRGSDISFCYELGSNEASLCSLRAGSTIIEPSLSGETGTVTYENIFGEVTFTLECTGGDTDSVTVKVLPEFQET